jgi:deoxyribonuclease V
MIAIFDTHYNTDTARTACVLLRHWEDETPAATYTELRTGIAAYEPGAFYKRELPCLLSLLQQLQEPVTIIVIDGYVWLGDAPGLGAHLHESLQATVPVIGVAKTKFHNNFKAQELRRGSSNNPLYITSIGMKTTDATTCINNMHGAHRIPAMLKLCDQLSRT